MTQHLPTARGRSQVRNAAIIQKLAHSMMRLGVAALPRNYELIYEALSGQMPQLSRDLAALGPEPTQEALDELGIKHKIIGHSALAADRARAEAQQALGELATMLGDTLARKHAFNGQLKRFAARLASDPVTAMSEFADEAAQLRDAAGLLMNEETALRAAIEMHSQRLGELEGDLEESRMALTRDRLTGLPNQAALSKRLAAVFDQPSGQSAALVVATVEGLRDLGEQHGGALAQKVLSDLATIFRKTIKKNDFVARVGPQEFAFVCNDVTAENAEAIARRIHQSVAELAITPPGRAFTSETLSLSAGIALTTAATSAAELLGQAELALTAARANGGIRVYSSDIERTSGKAYVPDAA
ncbi:MULTISPECIES: GGDEF domain-containing protein [unclassified Sinorhizobium]|uniref:GGDEF domain-containing protein n=1 Tax=unclassified Sinorhizobium TaxID=2613772 RepID=UPI0024C3AFED|nr:MULTISPECIES: GGDEF domain-containing protein [unclassified Sinorhizobium]MDK1376332.1 GGDEF domain-containing protein [Sinorhizobium sp. 6-70]MDK1478137.1 GGDEF domain-containing protein [Sinorhizobium sp. 6-117]